MSHLFVAIHYAKWDHADDLLGAVARFAGVLETTRGVLDVTTWRDGVRIVAMSAWESKGALQAAMPVMTSALADSPFDEWEERERELFKLHEFEVARLDVRA